MYSVKQNINLVLEFLDTDLEAILRDNQHLKLENGDYKSWMMMTLRGLQYIHRHGVLHRVSAKRRLGDSRADREILE